MITIYSSELSQCIQLTAYTQLYSGAEREHPRMPEPIDEQQEDNLVEALDDKGHLLWVHQSPFQRRLLERYGGEICLLDATYRTSCYDLPVFFLCVNTNVGYSVVATIVAENQRISTIREELEPIMVSPSFHGGL